jgi:ribosomal protein S1
MSELTFEQMLEASFKTIHTGEVIEGTVIDVKPEEAILYSINYTGKSFLSALDCAEQKGNFES